MTIDPAALDQLETPEQSLHQGGETHLDPPRDSLVLADRLALEREGGDHGKPLDNSDGTAPGRAWEGKSRTSRNGAATEGRDCRPSWRSFA